MTDRGRIVTWAQDRKADIEQARVFHALLAEQRVELCDRLDAQGIKLDRYEGSDSAGARQKRRQLNEIGSEIRDIDRMMHALSSRLLAARQDPSV